MGLALMLQMNRSVLFFFFFFAEMCKLCVSSLPEVELKQVLKTPESCKRFLFLLSEPFTAFTPCRSFVLIIHKSLEKSRSCSFSHVVVRMLSSHVVLFVPTAHFEKLNFQLSKQFIWDHVTGLLVLYPSHLLHVIEVTFPPHKHPDSADDEASHSQFLLCCSPAVVQRDSAVCPQRPAAADTLVTMTSAVT